VECVPFMSGDYYMHRKEHDRLKIVVGYVVVPLTLELNSTLG